MHSQVISKEALSDLRDWQNDCKHMKKALLTESSRETNPSIKVLYKSLAASFVNAELISSWIELSFSSINDLGRLIDNMSNRQEFNLMKKELNAISKIKHIRKTPREGKRSRKTH